MYDSICCKMQKPVAVPHFVEAFAVRHLVGVIVNAEHKLLQWRRGPAAPKLGLQPGCREWKPALGCVSIGRYLSSCPVISYVKLE